jgi:hypothetical protein
MMRLLIAFIMVMIIFNFTSCKKEGVESNNDEATTEIEINIIDLFNNIDNISEVSTMTTEEYIYTIKDSTLISELINTLKSFEYKEVGNFSPETEDSDGPSESSILLQFYYDDGSKPSIKYYYTTESAYAEYTSVVYNPFNKSNKLYQVNDGILYKIMEIMYKGEALDLNAQSIE